MVEKFNDIIEDTLIKILSIKKLPFAKHFLDSLNVVEEKIISFKKISAQFSVLQQKWLKNRDIFFNNDVDMYIPDQKESFKQIDGIIFDIQKQIGINNSVNNFLLYYILRKVYSIFLIFLIIKIVFFRAVFPVRTRAKLYMFLTFLENFFRI